ncbi:MAG: hypothetical protein ACI8Z5_001390 [Lentimonas sp.]|jgi:hypothetical protein
MRRLTGIAFMLCLYSHFAQADPFFEDTQDEILYLKNKEGNEIECRFLR